MFFEFLRMFKRLPAGFAVFSQHPQPRIKIPESEAECNKIRNTSRACLLSCCAVLALCLTPSHVCASSMYDALWSRSWTVLDQMYKESVVGSAPLSSRDISIYANALWMQRRYEESVAVLEGSGSEFPPSVAPYAGMLSVLGMERTGRKEEALARAGELWNGAPVPMRYYLAYALGRTSRDLSRPEEAISWFRRMLEHAPDKKRRIEALSEIVGLPDASTDEAALLLVDQPSNAKALLLCRSAPKGSSAKVEYALGYHAYLRKNYAEAVSRLPSAYRDPQFGEAARYYHAYALYRQDKNASAFELWSWIAKNGNDYPQRSVQRLATLAQNGMKESALRVFRVVADTRADYPDLAADALAACARFGEGESGARALEELTARFPTSTQAALAWWTKGWHAWKSASYREAEMAWGKGYAPGIKNTELAARLLYWRMRALEKLGDTEAASRVRERLVAAVPGEFYTYLVAPDGGLISGDLPAAYGVRSELEEWGFLTYARLEAASPDNANDPEALFRAVRLANWEGDFGTSVRTFALLQKAAPTASPNTSLLKYSYPRAHEGYVAAASGRTGLDPAIIWGVMRQESLYEADVTSVAGAYGLMQLMPATGREEAKRMKLPEEIYKEPSGNVLLGSNHMIGLIARFKDLPRALAAYNAGGSRVVRWSSNPILDMVEWIEDIPFNETRGYVKAVMRNVETYRILYGGK